MSQVLEFENFGSDNILARTTLTADIAAGVSSLPVTNSNDFAAGPVLVGDAGNANSELLTATTISSATAIPTSGASLLPHNFNEPIYRLYGSQIKVYTAADISNNGTQPPDANFSLLTTINIDASKPITSYTNASDNGGLWYKYTYYNGSTETNRATQNAFQSGNSHFVNISDIKSAAGFANNQNISDLLVSQKRDAAEKEVLGALLPVYNLPLPQPYNPIVVEIVRQLSAGLLMHEVYTPVSASMAMLGEEKARQAREGGGTFTGLQELVHRDVVLMDANFVEQTVDEGHGVGGWPDESTNTIGSEVDGNDYFDLGYDQGHQFKIDEMY